MIGQNYLRSLFALGFQGFLIMVCVGIYAVLIQSVAFSSDIIGSLWGVMGYTILLAFTLFGMQSLQTGLTFIFRRLKRDAATPDRAAGREQRLIFPDQGAWYLISRNTAGHLGW